MHPVTLPTTLFVRFGWSSESWVRVEDNAGIWLLAERGQLQWVNLQ